MIHNNSNEPINPIPHINEDGTVQHDVYFGLTKREYFAGLAMQGLLSHGINKEEAETLISLYPNKTVGEAVTAISVQYADQLLKQLEL